jgi:hypothetical protein
MPLLPGETRERDVYTSGLSFIDSAGKQLKNWANQTQESIESAWVGLTAAASEARPAATIEAAIGPMVPSRLYLDDDAILFMLSRAVITVKSQLIYAPPLHSKGSASPTFTPTSRAPLLRTTPPPFSRLSPIYIAEATRWCDARVRCSS